MGHQQHNSIIDIGGSKFDQYCLAALEKEFFASRGHKPPYVDNTLMSCDEGLGQWRTITRLKDYYQSREEISLFKKFGQAITDVVIPGCILIDLGAG
jgi:uncharacterized SAM-dependent methyltransferase